MMDVCWCPILFDWKISLKRKILLLLQLLSIIKACIVRHQPSISPPVSKVLLETNWYPQLRDKNECAKCVWQKNCPSMPTQNTSLLPDAIFFSPIQIFTYCPLHLYSIFSPQNTKQKTSFFLPPHSSPFPLFSHHLLFLLWKKNSLQKKKPSAPKTHNGAGVPLVCAHGSWWTARRRKAIRNIRCDFWPNAKVVAFSMA